MRKILVFSVLCLVVGCASYQPVSLTQNKYTNPKYGVQFQIPSGWSVTTNLPYEFQTIFEKKSDLMLMSNISADRDHFGVIYVNFDKTFLNIDSMIAYGDIDKHTEKTFKKQRSDNMNNASVVAYDYSTYSPQGSTYPALYGQQKISTRTLLYDFRHILLSYIYPCGEDDTCVADIGLFSTEKIFDSYKIVFDRFVESFKSFLQESKDWHSPNVADKSLPLSEYDRGRLAFQGKDYTLAYSIWKNLAENGDAEAAFRLSEMYIYSEGVPQDYSQSTKWLLMSSEYGHGDAQCKLANRYETRLCVEKNIFKSYVWRWRCLHNKKTSRRVRYQADKDMSSISKYLSREEIKQVKHATQLSVDSTCSYRAERSSDSLAQAKKNAAMKYMMELSDKSRQESLEKDRKLQELANDDWEETLRKEEEKKRSKIK